MISLVGATLYENVDLGGQIIQPDIKSGINAFQVVISALGLLFDQLLHHLSGQNYD